MTHEIMAAYSTRQSGNIGHEIVDPNGVVIAWTIDAILAQRIVWLLNGVEGQQEE